MKTVTLPPDQVAILDRNLSTDKKFVAAQRRVAKRERDEQRRRERAIKALDLVAAMAQPDEQTKNPHIVGCIAGLIDRFPVKVGKTWIR